MNRLNKLEIYNMFATNYCRLEKELSCDGQCQGECSGHHIALEINNTSNVGCIVIDGIEKIWLSDDEADALYEMFIKIKNE